MSPAARKGLAALALAALILAAFAGRERGQAALEAYLAAWLFWLGPGLGALALLLLHAATGGRWGERLRPALSRLLRGLPVWGLLFLPIAVGLPGLYAWAGAEAHHASSYLTRPLFLGRAALYFLIWLRLRRAVASSSRAAGLGLVAIVLTTTLAAIDWMMSLEFPWVSTGYGLMVLAGHAVSGLCAGLCFLFLLRRGAITEEERRDWHDLGTLLLVFIAVWAYLSFAQYLIVWSGNIPEEAVWYLRRSEGPWRPAAVALALLHFAVPLLVLLSREAKRRPALLAATALGVLAMRALDTAWLVLPAFPGSLERPWGLDLLVFAGLGCAWLALSAPEPTRG